MKNIVINFAYILYRSASFFNKHRSLTVFLVVFLGIVGIDMVFHNYLFKHYSILVQDLVGLSLDSKKVLDIGWLPEVWLGVLVLVVSTLIIVISIAAQNVPEIIGLYMRDWLSLLYLWFLIISGIHAIVTKFYVETENTRFSSIILNMHWFLIISSILVIPYIFYILQHTRPTNVIKTIFHNNLALIRSLVHFHTRILFRFSSVVEEYQFRLCESINQLDDLLEYVDFKEPKTAVILSMNRSLQEFIRIKSSINPNFFKVTSTVRSDITFKYHTPEQFEQIEQNKIFYEEKITWLLGDAYLKLLEAGEFGESAVLGKETSLVGLSAIQAGEDDLISYFLVRFNTLLRLCINHGISHNELRHLYNIFAGYRSFAEYLVEFKKIKYVKEVYWYFKIYGHEIFRHSKNYSRITFIVDVIALEMKNILIQIYNDKWDMEIQDELLNEMLQVDRPLHFNRADLENVEGFWGTPVLIGNGVRILQIGLALFYQREGLDNFVIRITQTILDDLEIMGEQKFRQAIEESCNLLLFFDSTFWEDTDRGNINIYYTPDKDQVAPFKARIYEQMENRLRS